MENFTHIVQTISATLGVAWASGINLYAALLVIGLLGATGSIALPEHLQLLSHPLVLAAAGFMYLVEFIADKIPGVDSTWDAIHTFIRIPAGAVLAAGMAGSVDPAISLAAAVVGGGLAAGTHATKAGTRVLINTSPEPFSNWTASVSVRWTWAAVPQTSAWHPRNATRTRCRRTSISMRWNWISWTACSTAPTST